MVRAAVLVDDCAPYVDAEHAKEPRARRDAGRGSGPTSPASPPPTPRRRRAPAARATQPRGPIGAPAGRTPLAAPGPASRPSRPRRCRHGRASRRGPRGDAPDAGRPPATAPRLPARPMTRRAEHIALVASPVLIGAVTVMVTIIAVFLAYNANKGLPFVPTLEVKVRAENSAVAGRGSRCARAASGSASYATIRTRPAARRRGRAPRSAVSSTARRRRHARGHHVHDPAALPARPEVPRDGARRARTRDRRQDHVFPAEQTTSPVRLDDFTRIYDDRPGAGIRRNIAGLRQRARGPRAHR